MRNLLNAKWILLVSTLPVAFILFYFYRQYTVIHTLLGESEKSIWLSLALWLTLLGLLHLAYALYHTLKKKPVSLVYGIVSLILQVAFMYAFYQQADKILPASIPAWMLPDEVFFVPGGALMPAMFYSLLVIVVKLTENKDKKQAGFNFLYAISIPVIFYVFAQIVLPLWRPVDEGFGMHTLIILIVAGTVFFLFFLIRSFFILSRRQKNNNRTQWLSRGITLLLAIILPLLGLFINNDGFAKEANILGDFSHPLFYIITSLNGIFLLLPTPANRYLYLALYALRMAGLCFTAYFFFVLLPFLPFAVIAIIAVGVGFLLLSPTFLLFIQVRILYADYQQLQKNFKNWLLIPVTVLAFIFLPVAVTAYNFRDREILHNTLEYVFTPSYNRTYQLHPNRLAVALHNLEGNRKNRHLFASNNTPFLSAYYRSIVLDNMTLSREKVNYLKSIIWGENIPATTVAAAGNRAVKLQHINGSSHYDEQQQVWISEVDVALINTSSSRLLGEYQTSFQLPEGCWINDYYLYVGNKKEKGLLTEKNAALWVYRQITREQQDPGLITYEAGGRISWKVFPFQQGELRKTGIRFLHKEPFVLTIDGQAIQLGKSTSAGSAIQETEQAVYIPAAQKAQLPEITRTPYFHFIIDASVNGAAPALYEQQMNALAKQYPALLKNAQITVTGATTTTYSYTDNWQAAFNNPKKTGFFLDRAIRQLLVNAHQNKQLTAPVPVVLSPAITNAAKWASFADLQFTYPDADNYFHLQGDTLMAYPLFSNVNSGQEWSGGAAFTHPVKVYIHPEEGVRYLQHNKLPEFFLKTPSTTPATTTHTWEKGLNLYAQERQLLLKPYKINTARTGLLKESFITGILTAQTAYIVVENEAQQQALLRKQQETISGKTFFDTEENTPMSEPSVWITGLLAGIIWWKLKKRKAVKI